MLQSARIQDIVRRFKFLPASVANNHASVGANSNIVRRSERLLADTKTIKLQSVRIQIS